MIRNRIAGVLLALGGAAFSGGLSTPAQAQFFFGRPVLPERAVVDMLREDGFRRISQPVLNRDVYFLDAIDPDGEPVRLIVGAYDGEILQAHPRRDMTWRRETDRDFGPRMMPPAELSGRPRASSPQALAPTAPLASPPAAKPHVSPAPPRSAITPPAPKAPAAAAPKTPVAPKIDAAKPADPVRPAEGSKPVEAAKPLEAAKPADPAVAAAANRTAPRVIEISPPAVLDDVKKREAPAAAPMVPPATLD